MAYPIMINLSFICIVYKAKIKHPLIPIANAKNPWELADIPGLRLHKAKHTMTGIYPKSIVFPTTQSIVMTC